MCGCSRRAASANSREAGDVAADARAERCPRGNLSATWRCCRRSSASQTSANPPAPNERTSAYRSSMRFAWASITKCWQAFGFVHLSRVCGGLRFRKFLATQAASGILAPGVSRARLHHQPFDPAQVKLAGEPFGLGGDFHARKQRNERLEQG